MSLFEELFDLNKGYININSIRTLENISKNASFNEKFDSNKLTFILNNIDKVKEKYRDECRNLPILDSYLNNSITFSGEGVLAVKYQQKDNEIYGRYYAQGALSGGNMVREVRHTIFNDYYVDLDIDNCHPNIILWLCLNMDIQYNYLNQYINNRNNIFEELVKLNPDKTKGFFKSTFLSINNGGEKNYKQIENKNEFIINYFNEMRGIREQICDKLHQFKSKTQKLNKKAEDPKYNIEGKTMANICLFVENQLLLIIMKYLKKKIRKEEFNQSILCFDGIMLRENVCLDIDIYMREIEQIFKKMNINIKLSLKEMIPLDLDEMGYNKDEKYIRDIVQLVETDVETEAETDETKLTQDQLMNYFDFTMDYYWSDFKNELSRKVFQSEEECCLYLQKNLGRVCCFVNNNVILKKDPVDSYEILSQSNWGLVRAHYLVQRGKQTVEVKKKICDITIENMKYFNVFNHYSADFSFPRNQIAFDLSKPFIGKMTDYNENNTTLLNKFKSLIKELFCGDDEKVFNYLWYWLAFTVKYPHLKTKVGLLLISKQGCGKGFFIDFLCNYIYGKYNCIPNMNGMDQLIGDKNAHLLGKKLVCVNELSSNKDCYSSNSNKIKSIITEEDMMIRPLYCNAFNAKQTCELILSSNHLNSVIMEESDRRWFVLSINEKYRNNKDFFGEQQELFYNQDMGDIMYTDLMNQSFSISDFYKLHIPLTDKKEQIKNISKSSSLLFIDEIRERSKTEPTLYPKDLKFKTMDLFTQFLTWCNENNEKHFSSRIFKYQITEYGVKYIRSNGSFYQL